MGYSKGKKWSRSGSKAAGKKRKKPRDRVLWTRWDRSLGRYVVVKRHRSLKQAKCEARVMRAYGDNPYLVKFCRFYKRRGRGYVVMERLPNRTLHGVIKRRGPFSPWTVIAFALSILAGVEALHQLGYVHGDLHSRNVMVTNLALRQTKLIDMQHAVRKNRRGRAKARRRLVKPPVFLAPESTGRVIDDRYDIYGVGFMCACMLLGKELNRRPKMKELSRRSPALAKIIRKAMCPKKKYRYRSVAEMREDLLKVAERLG